MNRRTPWPWLVYIVWNAWIYALLGWGSSVQLAGVRLGPWLPDLGLVLLLGLEPGLSRRGALLAALLCALSRASFSAEPATALVAGYIGCVWLARAVRTVVESDGPLPRTVLVASSAFLLCIFWGLVRTARNLDPLAASSVGLAAAVDAGLKIALATGLASLALLPLILRLPGLTTLRGRMT
ncbi:MAG: hypothetical protein O7B99_06170 [Planctomycetota bacterium]|nr:hypothetical protein [Planctomycetota bacterium]